MGVFTLFLGGLEGVILIGPSLFFWEHGALPNRTTSLDHQSHNRNKYDPYGLPFQFIYMRVELWKETPKGRKQKQPPSNQIERVKNKYIVTKQ
jgi:hypothetical protein